jgi:hypothetical protein
VPPWFAGASRSRPQRSTPTRPRNGRRRPEPTPNSRGERNSTLPPTGWAQSRSSGVSFRGGAGGIRSDCRSLDCADASYFLHQRFWEYVRMWRGGYHGVGEVSRRILTDDLAQSQNGTGPQSDTLRCRTTDLAHRQYLRLTHLLPDSTLCISTTCSGRSFHSTPVAPVQPEQILSWITSWTVRVVRQG